MPQTDIITFTNVAVDSDTDIRLVKKGNVVYMLNCIKEGDGDNGVITNMKGSSAGLVTLPAGTNKVVAACDDPERSRVIFFLWNINSGNKLAIFYITKSSASSGFILNPFSGYDPRNISNPRVVDRYLLFTNGTNEPACIDMVKFYNTTNSISTTDKYSSITADLFTVIKPYPVNTLRPTYLTDTSSDYNFLTGQVFQFAYRFVYEDNSKSILSDYNTSGVNSGYFTPYATIPAIENVDGSYSAGTNNNAISIRINDFGDERVSHVELYVRNSASVVMSLYDTLEKPSSFTFEATTSGAAYIDCTNISDASALKIRQEVEYSGQTYIVTKIDGVRVHVNINTPPAVTVNFTATQILNYYFKNDTPFKGVNEEDVSRIIDLVPIKASLQEVVEDSRIIYAGITEGYDNVNANVAIGLEDYNIESVMNPLVGLDITSDATYYYIAIPSPSQGYTYWISAESVTATEYAAVYVAKAGDTSSIITSNLALALTVRGLAASSVGAPDRVRIARVLVTTLKANLYYEGFRNKFLTIKSNSKLQLGIIYRDKYGRSGNVNPINSDIDTSYSDFSFPSSIHLGMNYYRVLKAYIKHLPPEWAYTYRFAAVNPNEEYCQYAAFLNVNYMNFQGGKFYIRLNKQLELAREITGHVIPSYVFQKGDKVRLLGLGYVGSGSFGKYERVKSELYDIQEVYYAGGDADYKKDTASTPSFITDADGNKLRDISTSYIVTDIALYRKILSEYGAMGTLSSCVVLFEVVKFKEKPSDNVYYEIGDEYSVINPGTATRSHSGDTQNQLYSDPINTPAISELNWGNAWVYIRHLVECYFACESPFPSDYYITDLKPYGRPNVPDVNARQKTLGTMLRWGGKFVDNSFINRINRFDFDDYKLLNEKHGAITVLALAGYVLKALTQKKETSIYVNRNILTNADGSQNITASSVVLNVADPYVEDRGTLFPHSICIVNRDMYYVDTLRGQFVRSSPNGQIPVSDLGKRKAFKALCDAVNSTIYSSDIVTYYDDENRLIFVTFLIDGTNTTLGFHEPSNSWMDHYSFTPEYGFGVGEECYAASGGQVYRLNDSNASRCTFFGQKYDQVVEFVQNENSAVVKQYKDISLVSNKKWTVYPIEVLANDNSPRGMISRLSPFYFKSKEGVYCAEYLRNMKTSSNTESAIDLINGDRLRGNECKHRLTNSENGKVELFRVKIDYEISNTY